MAEATEELEAFRAEARAWLKENFPAFLKGRGGAVMTSETIDASERDALAWGKSLGEKGWVQGEHLGRFALVRDKAAAHRAE